MSLSASISVQVGGLAVDVAIDVKPGEVVALLGPNGAGKTTALRCLAGLRAVDSGLITIDDVVVDDPASGVFVEPERRAVGVVFQDYLLFPHMSALENVAFGLRARGVPKSEARHSAARWIDQVGLADHARHKPRALSGGQAQRVALARALVTEPRLLLLDEPLAALDAGTRASVRRDLRRFLDGFDGMRLLVTHDPVDAYALADRVVVIEDGRIVQSGTLSEVTAHPRSRYVADLVGLNLLTGTLSHGVLLTSNGADVVTSDVSFDGPALAAIAPQAVALYEDEPHGSPRNSWLLTVVDIDLHADRARVRLDGAVPLVSEITPGGLAALSLQPGSKVWATVKAAQIATYPA